ncbi:hypothetical protein [Reichenbachiella sp.]
MSIENVHELSGIVTSDIQQWENDGSHYIDFSLDSLKREYSITGHAYDAIKDNYGIGTFLELLHFGIQVDLGVKKDDFHSESGSVDIIYIAVAGKKIIRYEDYEEAYDDNIQFAHNYFWVPLLIALAISISAIFLINFNTNDELTIPDGVKQISLSKIQDFQLGEYWCTYNKERNILQVKNNLRVLIRIDFNSRIFVHKPLGFEVFTKFDDIEKFGIKNSEEGETDIYLKHKRGMQFNLLNTKSNGFWFLDDNRKVKEKLEIIFLSIFYSIKNTPPNIL